MGNENGEWFMHGMSWDDPYRIRTWQELVDWIKEVGFLPFFANGIPGFSAEEHVSPDFWWTGDRNEGLRSASVGAEQTSPRRLAPLGMAGDHCSEPPGGVWEIL